MTKIGIRGALALDRCHVRRSKCQGAWKFSGHALANIEILFPVGFLRGPWGTMAVWSKRKAAWLEL